MPPVLGLLYVYLAVVNFFMSSYGSMALEYV